MRFHHFLALSLAIGIVSVTSGHAASFVGRSGQSLTVDGKPLRLHGGSFYGAPWRQERFNEYVDTWLDKARDNGMNTLRICDFIDNKNLEQWKDARTWANVDYLLKALEARKMYAILDLSTYRNLLNQINGKDTPAGVAAAYDASQWSAFTAFVAARYRKVPCIAFYSIAGECEAPAGKKITGAAMTDFFDKVSTQLRNGDPNHLISTGGLLFLDWNSGIDWKTIFRLPNIQMAAVHVYSKGDVSVVPKIAEWAGQPSVGIPLVIEEFGFKQGSDDAARAAQFREIYALGVRHSTVGSLFWNFGPEQGEGSCDVGPQTPQAWKAVRDCSPLSRPVSIPAAKTIRNEQVTVTCEQNDYSLHFRGQSKPFATGRLRLPNATVKVVAVKDADFGEGQALVASAADGSREVLQVFPGLPFVLYSATLANSDRQATTLNKVPMMKVELALDKPLDQLTTLGTGGLKSMKEEIRGSFAWAAVADPATRRGVVGGWLTHEHATGLVFVKAGDGRPSMEARLEYGHLPLGPGMTYQAETFALGWFADARLGLEAWADAVAKRLAIKLPPMPIVYCTWYDNEHNGSSNAKYLAELSACAAEKLKPYGFTCVQIDDGWQMGNSKGNGPAKNFSQFNPRGNYPNGMKPTAEHIKSLGMTAGLWILPFGGSWNDPFFEPHQEWFVKRKSDGKPFDTAWGGTALDMTQPGARAFVEGEIKQAVHDWGYSYLKLDGLSTGMGVKPTYANDSWLEDNFGDAVFHDPSKSNVEVFRDGLRLIRKAAGPDTFILGCCAPQNMRSYAGVFGLVDAMRMGPDNGGSWAAWKGSAVYGSRNYHLNGRIWWSDPDPIYVRSSIPLESARCLASWNALSGQMISISDWLPTLPAERIDILRRVIPGHGVTARPIDLFNEQTPKQWLVTDERPGRQRRDVIGLFNWSYQDETAELPLARLGLPSADEYVAFDFWNRVFVKLPKHALTLNVPGASCRILAVRPLLPRPFLISTSRHVTQGILEVKQETWNADTNTLSGTSAMVAGDVYELRVVACSPQVGWTLAGATVAKDDKAAGVTVSATDVNGLVRVTITSPTSRDVKWAIRFAAGNKATPPAKIRQAAGNVSEDGEDIHLSWVSVDGTVCEVVCGDGEPVVSQTGTCLFPQMAPDKEYHFRLTAVSWSGQRSEATELNVKTPKARALPPVPPKPTVDITSLKPAEAQTGYGDVRSNTSMDGKPITLSGTVHPSGIGVHANSRLVYEVKPEYRRFVAVAGIDDEVKNSPASVVFQVIAEIGDECRPLASSPRLRARRGLTTWHFDVALPTNCRRLRLVVDDAGDGINNDHADWAAAGFITDNLQTQPANVIPNK